MPWHENGPNPLDEYVRLSDIALGRHDLKKLSEELKLDDDTFNLYIRDLERNGCFLRIKEAAEVLGVEKLRTQIDPHKRLFYSERSQLEKWFEKNNTYIKTSPMPNATPIEKRLKIYSACDRGLSHKEAAKEAEVSPQVAAEQFRKWNAIPTYVLDGAFGTDGGVTFIEVKHVTERRLDDDNIPDSLLHEKLEIMEKLGYCEIVEKDGGIRYKAKKQIPLQKRR